jgi:hypothetical protein
MQFAQDLIAAETDGWQALTTDAGADYYERHLTADAIMGFSSGVMTRAEAIEAMRASEPWASFTITDPHVVELTPDSGVLVYRASARRAGHAPYTALVSSAYVRQDGRWLLAFHQQTPM